MPMVKILKNAIHKNIKALKSTNEIKRLSVSGNVFEKIKNLSNNCYKDNGICFISSEELLYTVTYKTSEIVSNIQKNILKRVKVPHNVSQPVLYLENEKYYLAFFVFFFNKEDIEKGKVDRPMLWVIADINTGKIIEKRRTKEKEFTDASYDIKYNICADEKYDTSKEYYEKAFAVLDTVRMKIIEENILDKDEYLKYLNMIVANIPSEYKRFFYDLSV
jgi:hypothetical protein